MSEAGFDPTITESERLKRVHALDRAATVIGTCSTCMYELNEKYRVLIGKPQGERKICQN
jgi:hypothetical protein